MDECQRDFDERKMRLNRLEEIKKTGIIPYPARASRTMSNKSAIAGFEQLSRDSEAVFCVGRVRLLRRHGGSTFADIEDQTSLLQVFFSKDALGVEKYLFLKNIDVGDFLEVGGEMFKTRKGEITLKVNSYKLLAKSLLPLPDKWHGLKNQEERYRRRYVDLIMNPQVRDLFRKKSAFIQEFRNFYLNKGFVEVQTPVLEDVPGGAEADPFVTHHNALDIDLYLRISLELHLKRLIVGGYEKIFEIGPVFRNEGMSPQHLQEFTMLESYEAYKDYNYFAGFVEELYSTVIKNIFGTMKIKYKGHELDFEPAWPRLDYYELVDKHAGIDLRDFTDVQALKREISKKGISIEFEEHAGLGRVIDQLYKKTVRPGLIQPCLLMNHPLAVSPLSKNQQADPNRVERIQVLIAGSEIGNAYSELNDPQDQKKRFKEQSRLREAGDSEAQMMDQDYIEALEYGMPPAVGFGVGIERLFMICTNSESVRDVVFFPTMKKKNENP